MAKLKFYTTLLLTLYFCNVVQSASILALFSSLSYSDHLVFRGYVSRLAQAGHNVAVMTAYPGHHTYPDVEKILELDVSNESMLFWNDWTKLVTNNVDLYAKLPALNELSVKTAIAQLTSKHMTALLLNPNVKFDLVITEADVPVLYGAAEKYQVPHIALTTSSGKIHQYEAKGNPVHPILYPDVNALEYRDLSYWQQLVEIYRHIQTKQEYDNHLSLSDHAAKKIFGIKRELLDIEQDIDMLFVAANPLVIGNRPTVPGIIYTDRLHINPGFSLPPNLKATLDAATKGVVYFSLGAVQESEALAPALLNTLTEAFKELPFTVLWKIGNTTAINKPDNVITGAWFPQQEVLAHPNVKAFITHGGPRSLEEAIFYTVPIVGLPIVKSRKVFIGELTRYGAGEILDPHNLEKEDLKNTITAVATDAKYKKAVSKLKSIAVDSFVSGPDDAMWWTEYVIRNGGAKHFKSPAVGLSFFKYYMLDVVGILLVGAIVTIWIMYAVLRSILRKLLGKFSSQRFPDRFVDDSKYKAL